jgi:hypothetical protein
MSTPLRPIRSPSAPAGISSAAKTITYVSTIHTSWSPRGCRALAASCGSARLVAATRACTATTARQLTTRVERSTLSRTFAVLAEDVAISLGPELLTRVRSEAPQVALRFVGEPPEADGLQLRDGRADLDIGVMHDLPRNGGYRWRFPPTRPPCSWSPAPTWSA